MKKIVFAGSSLNDIKSLCAACFYKEIPENLKKRSGDSKEPFKGDTDNQRRGQWIIK